MNIQSTDDFYNASGIDRRYFFMKHGYNNKRLAKYFKCSPTLITLTLDKEKSKKLDVIANSMLVKKLINRNGSNGKEKNLQPKDTVEDAG